MELHGQSELKKILKKRKGNISVPFFCSHNIKKEEEVAKAQYEQLLLKENELGDKLQEKYGTAEIDLKTGEITTTN